MDELAEMLAVLGHRIAELGCEAEPRIQRLARATRRIAPVASAVLASDDEPEVVRCRAFLRVALATAGLTSTERRALALQVDETITLSRVA